MMNQRQSPFIETEEEAGLPKTDGIVSAGIFGDTDSKAMYDRERRTLDFKQRYNYHEVVPCCACCNCIEIRKFLQSGEAVSSGFYCSMGELSTCENGTCDLARARRNGRRRVVYFRDNAPPGFEQGMAPVQLKRFYTKRDKKEAVRKEVRDGYRGGSSSYQRADGNREAVGSGKIPKGLGN